MGHKGERTKTNPDKTPGQKPPRTSEIEFVQRTFSGIFVLDLLKIGGGPRCVTYFRGVPGCVTKCDRGEGGQNWPKYSVTYFMDVPHLKIKFGLYTVRRW